MSKDDADATAREDDAAGEFAVILAGAICAAPVALTALIVSKSRLLEGLVPSEWLAPVQRAITLPFLAMVAFHWFFTGAAIAVSSMILLRPSSPRSRTIALAIAALALLSSMTIRSDATW